MIVFVKMVTTSLNLIKHRFSLQSQHEQEKIRYFFKDQVKGTLKHIYREREREECSLASPPSNSQGERFTVVPLRSPG